MGNSSSTNSISNPDCDVIFDKEIILTSDITNIIITLSVPAINNKRVVCNKYLLSTFGTDKIWFYPIVGGDPIPPADQTYHWSPQSYVTKDEYTLGEKIKDGRGIGVIIIESAQKYVKLYYSNNEFGVKSLYGLWNHEEGCRNTIEHDIEWGYDVLLINNIGELHFNKNGDENDNENCLITGNEITDDGNTCNEITRDENPFVETDENSTSKMSKMGAYIINLQNYHEHINNLNNSQQETNEQDILIQDIITLQ